MAIYNRMINECCGCDKCKCKKRFKHYLKEQSKDPSHPPFGTPEYFMYLSQLNDLGHIWHGLNNFRTWATLQYDSQPGDKSEPMMYAAEAGYDIMRAIKAGMQIDRVKQALSTLPGYLSGQLSGYTSNPFNHL